MAQFYQDPNPTSDPDYAKASREPDRVQADTSMGTLFEGIGKTVDVAGKAATTIFDTAIKKDVQETAKPVIDEHGGNIDVETAKAIAGTGAKGRVRALQMRNGTGDIDNPTATTPLGFAPDDTATAMAGGIFGNLDTPRPLPGPAQKIVDGVGRFNMAYKAGDLSDSAFSAELIAKTAVLKHRWPGFEDEVDAAMEKYTGQNSANAIRKSIMQDIQYNQAAALGAQSANDKFREKYRGEIAQLGYDPDKVDMEAVKAPVSQLLGQKLTLQSTQLSAAVGSPQAEQAVSDGVSLQATTSLVAKQNQAQGDKTLAQFTKDAQEMALRGGGSPTERAALANQMELAKQHAMLDSRKWAYSPIPDRADGHTPVSLMGPGADEKFGKILTNQYKPWDDAIALVNSGNMSALQQSTDSLKHQGNLDQQVFLKQFPQARTAAAINNAFPNNPIFSNRFLEKSNILPEFQSQVTQIGNAILAGTAKNPAPTPSEAMRAYGSRAANPQTDAEVAESARLTRQTVKQYNMVISPENKNPENAAHVALQFFKDQKFYDNMNDTARLKLFMTMASPEKQTFINKVASNSGYAEVKEAQKSWMLYAASDIWRRNSDTLQSYLTDKSFDIQYNPSTGLFEDHTSYADSKGSANKGQPQRIGNMLGSINNVVTLLKPMVGDNPEETLHALGVNPHADKEDGLVKRMFNALGDKLEDWRTSGQREEVKSGERKVRGTIKGNLSDQPIDAPIQTN